MEGLKADSRALTALVGMAQGDFRGCLNTLQVNGLSCSYDPIRANFAVCSQFIKTRNQSVTETVVRRATIGMKEADISQMTVLNDLFLPMTKKRAKELGIGEEEESRYVSRLSHEINRSGALDRIAIGRQILCLQLLVL